MVEDSITPERVRHLRALWEKGTLTIAAVEVEGGLGVSSSREQLLDQVKF